jgi:DUF4097 and DUF4098 domain-containing protein YvlB
MRTIFKKLAKISIALAAVAIVSTMASAQTVRVTPPEPPKPKVKNWIRFDDGQSSERSIKADPSLNVSLCVTQGSVKVNGWDRNELRVYVNDGSKFGFKVLQKGNKTGDPVWVMIVSAGKTNPAGGSECIWGGNIEIDAPVGSTLTIKGQDTVTRVDSIRKVSIKSIGGDISLRNIANGVSASAGQGDITVEESQGEMSLESTTGNIVAFEVGPSEIGDMFQAKTNSGAISLQSVEHRQMEVSSISGSVAYDGVIASGGAYTFSTSRGSIRLSLPEKTASQLAATYGFGNFSSEFPIKVETENVSPGPVKSVVGRMGTGGDALVKLTTNSGSISLKKRQ